MADQTPPEPNDSPVLQILNGFVVFHLAWMFASHEPFQCCSFRFEKDPPSQPAYLRAQASSGQPLEMCSQCSIGSLGEACQRPAHPGAVAFPFPQRDPFH